MKMNKSKFVVVALVFLSVVLFSGCINEEQATIESGVEIEFDYYDDGNIKSSISYSERGWNSYRNGLTTEWYQNGQKKFEGNYNYDESIGEWIEWYANGQLKSKGTYNYGYKIGEWIEWYVNGIIDIKKDYGGGENKKEIRYYENGQIKSKNNYYLEISGIRYYNECYFEFKQGKQMSWYESGEIESEGNYVITKNQRESYDGTYSSSTGTTISYYKNGQIKLTKRYLLNEKQGLWVEFFEDGSVKSEINYHSGDLNGTYLTYHNQTQIHEQGTYLNGEKQGQWIQWFPNGQLEHTAIYDKGVAIKNIEWYSETGEQIY